MGFICYPVLNRLSHSRFPSQLIYNRTKKACKNRTKQSTLTLGSHFATCATFSARILKRMPPTPPPRPVIPVLESLPVLLLLPVLSPLVRTEIPLKLLALVTAGFKLRRELSESVLLHGRGSEYFSSLSVLLWRLLVDLPEASLLTLESHKLAFKTQGPFAKSRERKEWNICRVLWNNNTKKMNVFNT